MPGFHSFASHIPVLIGVSNRILPKKILELGPGLFSTPMFADNFFLPGLINFTSVESEKEWYDNVKKYFTEDERVHLILASQGVADYVKTITTSFDLVFIDDSLTTDDRVSTIRAIGESKDLQNSIIVIHDFEVPEYQEASLSFMNRYIFQCYRPNIGVLWNGNIMTFKKLKQLEREIYKQKWKNSVSVYKDWGNL